MQILKELTELLAEKNAFILILISYYVKVSVRFSFSVDKSVTNTFVISSSPSDNILHLFSYDHNQLNKLQKIEIPRGISVKEKTVWIFKLYGVCYICHLFCCNNEDRLILYNTSKSEKVQVEDAFFILGKPGEAYAVNTVDNLVMVHFMNSKVGQET